MIKRRVVITGIGLVTPLGCGFERVCKRVFDGGCGIQRIDDNYIAALVPSGEHEWNEEVKEAPEFGKSKHASKFIEFSLLASDLSLRNAGIARIGDVVDPNRAGVAIGNGGIGSVSEIISANSSLDKSIRRLSPYFVPKVLVNMAAGQVSIRHQLRGPVHAVATACAAGAHSIGDAYNFIRLGLADLMLAGGSDASIDPLSLAGFARMKALADPPPRLTDACDDLEHVQHCSRPFHYSRDGFVMGEGAGILVLEELETALQRRAPILAEICGYGLSGDAFNATAPSADGDGAARSMLAALRDAGITPEDVGYINAHATSTPIGDAAEVEAIRAVFGATSRGSAGSSGGSSSSSSSNDSSSGGRRITGKLANTSSSSPLYVSSTKGATGHLLGAAGAVETALTVWALHTNTVPPTLHLHDSSIINNNNSGRSDGNGEDDVQSKSDVNNHVGDSTSASTRESANSATSTGSGIDPSLVGGAVFSHVTGTHSIPYSHNVTKSSHNDTNRNSDGDNATSSSSDDNNITRYNNGGTETTNDTASGKEDRLPQLQYALKNSFGFGGTNCSLVLGRYPRGSDTT
eukprot:CAMPEP_0175007188 /NCGR_PEP_ID=MMETSP0005-20121125/6269_1 /TAXON_ID=420556 /ORGANISM="Ochromonas sp., Strain CCMP1393" /LENGTH=576 /DNA_ID=CAMNT_0016262595 /DNA_START=33 /DNA_END=1763 /DNA_ORIENTATION=+